jgi:hypothetical protein
VKRFILPALVITFLLASCGAPDPRKEAAAYAARVAADQQAADSEQARQQSADLHAAEMQRIQTEQEKSDALAAQWEKTVNGIYLWGGRFLVVAICVCLLALAAGISYTSIGTSQAIVRAANVRANLVQLNPATRQFPLLIQHVHGNRYALINPNTDSVRMLDLDNAPDRQMIAAAGVTQLAGVLASEAARSSDPAGMAMISPQIINATENGLEVGDANLWKQSRNLLQDDA